MTDKFKDKKIAILGLGLEGLSSAKFFIEQGAVVTVFDKSPEADLPVERVLAIKKLGASLQAGSETLKSLAEFDLIVRSPGIKLSDITKYVDAAKITSQTKLFFDLCPCPIIGVTGTKGKGTTASLIYEMLKKSRKDLPAGRQDAYLGGNIGLPPLEFLNTVSDHSIVVLELSSFQLQDLTKSPHIAVMLMVTSEHLDYHKDLYEYIDAKRNILKHQVSGDFAIVNRDYIASNESDVHTNGKVFYVSRERNTDEGCFVRDREAIWLRRDGKEEKIIEVKDIALLGKHNLENVCAAAMAASLSGATTDDIASVLRLFKGLEHRLELVAEVKGVKYYNDSFSTTPETAIAAIEAFSEPEILILGGSSKNSDFTELGRVIRDAKNIKAIIGIGKEWVRIKSEVRSQKCEVLMIEGATDMQTIVAAAAKIAVPGDVVLLSPACASFDMFKNYKDRGKQFKEQVAKLS
ncbi:MAG TPA: UDP-N-acetylmuramoyl-L-alanine--D-glutamate ligase [Patescibacteria group bacterium]|nr:UDP-N-acetylmuramoyl-L-alanine--D-glutamate ligase [Patescibacteria group bacterium]